MKSAADCLRICMDNQNEQIQIRNWEIQNNQSLVSYQRQHILQIKQIQVQEIKMCHGNRSFKNDQ